MLIPYYILKHFILLHCHHTGSDLTAILVHTCICKIKHSQGLCSLGIKSILNKANNKLMATKLIYICFDKGLMKSMGQKLVVLHSFWFENIVQPALGKDLPVHLLAVS